MFAVIDCGGKQYKVVKGRYLFVDKLQKEVGDKFELDAVLGFDGTSIKTKGTKVVCEVLAQVLDDKVIVYKYKAKKNVRKRQGHRQPLTKINIVDIVL